MSEYTHYLSILQYNCNKPKNTVMADFLRSEETMKYGILAIQEPWAGNPYQQTTHNPVKTVFHLLYPPETGEQELPPRVCMFVSKDIAGASWKVTFHSPDLMTLHLEFPGETQLVINIHNIYNPSPSQGNYSSLPDLSKVLEVEGEHCGRGLQSSPSHMDWRRLPSSTSGGRPTTGDSRSKRARTSAPGRSSPASTRQ